MKKTMIFVVILTLLFSTTLVFADQDSGVDYISVKAKVLEVGELEELGEGLGQRQDVKVKILSGSKKNEEMILENVISENAAYNFKLKAGDKVVVTMERYLDTGDEFVNITDHYRLDYLTGLIVLFLLLILVVGKKKGIRAVISLSLTVLAVIYIILPNILKGKNPIVYSVIISVLITIVTIVLITGFTRKSLAAIIGTSLGVLIAGIISYIVGVKINLTGLSAEEATMLMVIPQKIDFNFRHILFAGIILGALGAVMDVAMSIASSIDEIYRANKELSHRELFRSGMNVGKDIMGTMVNTLILANTGTSIPILLLFMAYSNKITDVMNLDIIATEIVRSVSGSIGLILTIPVTAFMASRLIKSAGDKEVEEKE